MNAEALERHHSPEAVAQAWSVTVDTIYKLIHEQRPGQPYLRAVVIREGQRPTYRIPQSEVERFLNGDQGEVVSLKGRRRRNVHAAS